MSAELTEEQGATREMALEFAQTKFAGEWDEKKSLPRRSAPAGRGSGRWGVTGSEALDGSGLGESKREPSTG
jgi:hypothetical protein